MRVRLLTALIALLLCTTPAFGGQNPDIRIYLDADPPNYEHEIHPNASSTFDVYVCLDMFGVGGGTRGTGFLLQRTFQGFKLEQVSLLGGLDFGDAEVDGWTIVAGADCVYPDVIENYVVAGRITYLYLGVPGTLDVLPHPGTGRDILDCLFNSDDQWCVAANLGVSLPPNPGEEGCDWYSPRNRVLCEPQGDGNPAHPPTYWYDVIFGTCHGPIYGFHVQVFDPDIGNYTNWVSPPGWVHSESVQQIGDELWVSWCDPEQDDELWNSFRFQFDNPNSPAWGHWTETLASGPCDPFAGVEFASWQYEAYPDGYGYRVHAPVAPTSSQPSSWGAIKALFRQ